MEDVKGLLVRLSKTHSTLEWLDGFCDLGDAIEALVKHISQCSQKGMLPVVNVAREALRELVKRNSGTGTRNGSWQPTEQDIRECCGKWFYPVSGILSSIGPDALIDWSSKRSFLEDMAQYGARRIESIPEQCIPKPEPPKEYYDFGNPLPSFIGKIG